MRQGTGSLLCMMLVGEILVRLVLHPWCVLQPWRMHVVLLPKSVLRVQSIHQCATALQPLHVEWVLCAKQARS